MQKVFHRALILDRVDKDNELAVKLKYPDGS